MDGKELEIKRRFKAGDMVVFWMGERENQICPHCGSAFYNSEVEQMLIGFSGMTFPVSYILEASSSNEACIKCGVDVIVSYGILNYVLHHSVVFLDGQEFDGFAVYERELSPAPLENKNGMYRYLYGG